jgi:hypothetical protein
VEGLIMMDSRIISIVSIQAIMPDARVDELMTEEAEMV